MILDKLSNSGLYENVHPGFAKAFNFLQTNDLQNLALGKIELSGKDIVVNIVEMEGKTTAQAKMETHANFIDIQIPISGTEVMGWKPTADLQEVTHAYDAEKDVALYADKASNLIEVHPLEFAIFFPQDGHQPGIVSGIHKKIIVKIRV
ncbi:MAG: YhcH/YjgK/YiaL family protein [Porphyromonadaceae bacterium CG2_30_38_12]|nr:MAG: YhcH/YjgK/YiaL family protein [Porphyromonadaceae bacterium CG2_30_38_12]